jgi:hypothetical protein
MWGPRLAALSVMVALLFPASLVLFGEREFLMDPWENPPTFFPIVFLFPLAAILCGHLAIYFLRSPVQTKQQLPIAGIGLALGYAGLLIVLAWPILNHHHPHFDSSAVGSLRTLNTAAHELATVHGSYPTSLSDLSCQGGSPNVDWCIDDVLAHGMKSGYRFTYLPTRPSRDGQFRSYQIHGDPVKSKPFTRLHFYTDEENTIRYQFNQKANTTSTPLT